MKTYLNINVYEASCKRVEYIFNEFDNVLIAFSGGKDSGVCLNLCYDYAKSHGMLNKLAMYHLDYEAQYQMTTDYVTETFDDFPGIKKFWLCLPIKAQCAVNMSAGHWIPWEAEKEDIWVREMPCSPYVININNVPFKFKKGTWDYNVQEDFSKWYASEHGSTAVIIGIRSNESLNRYRAIKSSNKVNQYKELDWITSTDDITHNCYPIYDWEASDIWIANAKFNYNYNKLYDLYYQAGLSVDQMRVASPFNDCAIDTLKLYKAIDPNTWGKMISRVNGVNFAGIYGGTTAMGWKSITLPPGHTWKSYLNFLLNTLDDKTRDNYMQKFTTSIEFWKEKGGVLDDETINELKGSGIRHNVEGSISKTSVKNVVTFDEYPDDADVTNFKTVPSYKRMCICILKNDYYCKYMGFAQTKNEKVKRTVAIKKYKNIIRGVDC